jgi:hypothetical protein
MPIAAEYNSSLSQLETKFPGTAELKNQLDIEPIRSI